MGPRAGLERRDMTESVLAWFAGLSREATVGLIWLVGSVITLVGCRLWNARGGRNLGTFSATLVVAWPLFLAIAAVLGGWWLLSMLAGAKEDASDDGIGWG